MYGGTFDPVHDGHLAIARAVRDALGTTIWLMPAADPPHRDAPGASAEHRAAMLDLAIEGQAGLRVDRRELVRAASADAPSYTIDTLRELVDERPGAQWFLIIGADQARAFGTWREWRSILALATVCVAARGGSDGGASSLEGDLAGHALMLPLPRMDLSATQIRERVAAGQPVSDLAGSAVAGYIARQHLYSART